MVVREMSWFGIPWPIILLVLLLLWTANIGHSAIGFAAFFEGEGAQTRAFRVRGLQGHSHDIAYGDVLRLLIADTVFLSANVWLTAQ
jgi:hypothetical protein